MSNRLNDYITVREAAAIRDVSLTTIHKAIRSGRLPVIRVTARTYLVRRTDVEEMKLAARAGKTQPGRPSQVV